MCFTRIEVPAGAGSDVLVMQQNETLMNFSRSHVTSRHPWRVQGQSAATQTSINHTHLSLKFCEAYNRGFFGFELPAITLTFGAACN